MDSLSGNQRTGRMVDLTVTATDTGKYFCIFYYFLADRAYLMWDGSKMGDDSTARNVRS